MDKVRKQGEAVIVRSEEDFNTLKKLMGEKSLYLNWVPQMATRETAVVIRTNKKTDLSEGSVGCAEYQRSLGIHTIELQDYISK